MTYKPHLYFYNIASQVHVAAAATIHWDFFNADANLLVRVMTVRQIPGVITAVTGVATNWQLNRTTAVGTGGSAQTAWLPDLSQTGLDADITCRSKPTGGATAGTILSTYTIHSEETNAATLFLASVGGLELVPGFLSGGDEPRGLLLRPGTGLACSQLTNSAGGYTGWLIGFSVE